MAIKCNHWITITKFAKMTRYSIFEKFTLEKLVCSGSVVCAWFSFCLTKANTKKISLQKLHKSLAHVKFISEIYRSQQ